MTNFKLGELVQIAEQEGIFVYMGILTEEFNEFEKAQDIHSLYQCTVIYNKLVQSYQDSFNSIHTMSIEELEKFKISLFCAIEANVWYVSGRHVLTEIERNQHYLKCVNIKYLL